jgi:hypothetical protein
MTRRANVLQVLLWLVLLAAVLGLPPLLGSPTLGDDLIRWTVRLSLAYWAAAVTLMLWLPARAWDGGNDAGRAARWCWTFAWASYLVHLAMAFHFYHGWSHTDAMDHTRAVSGTGEGIYVSHLFTFIWTLDVLWWWSFPKLYAARPRWVGWLLHGFFAFIIFNGTVVYETGVIRYAALVMFAWLLSAAGIGFFANRRPVRDEPDRLASSP